ncbi:MAG: hypothetical protein KatS3mg009_0473 [Acidimicrobiia bacterium]|nr:MAG: hypothetical protein KatS3mg009_0473 [Acidimicrobiia bacterium]
MTRPARRSVRAAAALLAALAWASLTPPAGPAAAGGADPGAAGATLELVSQTPWAAVDGRVTIGVRVGAPVPPGTDVRLRVGPRVSTLDELEAVNDRDAVRGRILSQVYVPFADLLSDGTDAYLVVGLGRTSDALRLAVSAAGVYPLELALVGEDREVAASLLTWLVVTGDEPVDPADATRVAMVWTVERAPVRGPDGAADPEAVAELAPGGRLADIAQLLDEAAGVELTLRLGPETVESWSVLADEDPALEPGLGAVLGAATRRQTQLLPSPYVPIDLTSLEAADLGGRLPEQMVLGSDTIERLTGVTPDPRTMLADPVDPRTLERLRGLLVDRVVVPAAALEDGTTPTAPFELAAGDGRVRAVASNYSADDLLGGAGSTAQRVQRATAALAVPALGDGAPSGVVVTTPPRWQPDVATVGAFVEAIRRHPLIRPVTVDHLFDAVPAESDDGETTARDLAPHTPAPFPLTRAAYDDAAQDLASLRSTVGADDPGVERGERALRLALASTNDAGEASALLGVVDTEVAALRDGVSTIRKRVTLTARRADVPLTFVNGTGRPVSVRVELASSKLLFPDGRSRVVTLPPGNHTERFAVEARTSGTFTMTVALVSEDGRLPIGPPTRLTVRSAVFSGAGAALTVGAIVFLLAWWANHVRRTRRARRAAGAP